MKVQVALCFLAVALELQAQTPEWIWHPETNAPAVFFRKTFRTPPLIWNSRLTISADDSAEVFLNGVLVARCTDWKHPSRSEVTVRLNQGENVIAVKAQALEGARGLLVHLNLGGETNLVSNHGWLTATNEEPNWSALNFNAANWKNATNFGQHGVTPWGDVLFRASATAPESIKVAEGFKVELLRSAEPAEGSWICMTFDDKGRIIVSPQGDQRPLLRFTVKDGTVDQPEQIEAPIRYAMGLLQAFDSLYVNGIGPNGSGLYRLIDANKNDRFETNELHFLKGFKGGSEHGYHALALGPDKKIYVLNGNGTKLPDGISTKSPYRNYAEDSLSGERGDDLDGTRAPNCHVLRTDEKGSDWELFAGGMRNAYDFDFNEDGELFTFDSDNEWDWGVPWYRPTRVVHLVSGGEAGWRDGTRMWSERYGDAMPTTAYVGIGSPTGVKFGRGNHFPGKFRRALFLQDWSYGRIIAVHLKETGATYAGTVEKFLEGAPLNVTSLSFGPDGAMYFTTGGRGTQSGLYRVSYTGKTAVESSSDPSEGRAAREKRRKLEALHQGASASDLDFIWQNMITEDRTIRFAARAALETVPVEAWKDWALNHGLTALLALARVGSSEQQPAVLSRAQMFKMQSLSAERQLAKVRVIQVSLARHGITAKEPMQPLIDELNEFFPRASTELRREIVRVLLHMNAPGAVSKTLQLMSETQSREEQMFCVELLRNVKEGWTTAEREKFFEWFLPGKEQMDNGNRLEKYFGDVKRSYVDGASYDRYLRNFRREAMATLTAQERRQLEPLLAKPVAQARLVPANAREFVRDWKMEDLLPELGKARKADLVKGQQAFVDAQCLTCHRFGNDGGVSGPELTGAASKYTDRDLLESIVEPSKVISDQYQDHSVFLRDGEVLTGRLLNNTDSEVVVETDRVAGTKEKVERNKVENVRPATVSPMPQGLVNVLGKDEILDLLAYLRSGGK